VTLEDGALVTGWTDVVRAPQALAPVEMA